MNRHLVPVGVAVVVIATLSVAVVNGTRAAPEPPTAIAASATAMAAEPSSQDPPATPATEATPRPTATPGARGPTDRRDLEPEQEAPAPPRTWASATPVRRPAGGPAVAPGPPALRIPSLGITARLQAAEVVHGEYAVPNDPAVVGAHRAHVPGLERRLAPAPGVLLMSGHVAAGRVRGALWSLHALSPGDEILTTGPAGVRRWHARRLDVHRADALPDDLLRAQGPETLVLVTCSGPVVTSDGRRAYRDNLVVTATPA